MQGSFSNPEPRGVFAVDLDETLIQTDLLYERLLLLCRLSPLRLFQIPWFLLQGKLRFKKWIFSKVEIDFSMLPYRAEVLEKVRLARQRGETTLLLSASLQEDVDQVMRHLKLFDQGVGSRHENFKGAAKTKYLESHYLNNNVTYVGDSGSDFPVWKHGHKIIAVNPHPRLMKKIQSLQKPVEFICDSEKVFGLILKQLRVHQWVKNILVFIPVFSAHRFNDILPWIASLRGFFAFSFLASAVYVFNDLCDLKTDRVQEAKKHRPLASGRLPLKLGIALVPVCLVLGGVVSLGLPSQMLMILGGYLIMNVIYSFWVKEWLALDVIFLAIFYALRVLVGGAASMTPVSEWLLSFSIFFFTGLAMVKRFSEIKKQSNLSVAGRSGRRAYEQQDLMTVLVMGITTSIVSILVLALYLSTGEVQKLYRTPGVLWLVTPLLLYWFNRLWLLGARGEISEDPVLFAIKDKVTWGVVFVVLCLIIIAV